MYRLNVSSLLIYDAFRQLTVWIQPQMPVNLLYDHKKISDAQPSVVTFPQRIHNVVYFRCWWRFLKLNHVASFLSEIQPAFG